MRRPPLVPLLLTALALLLAAPTASAQTAPPPAPVEEARALIVGDALLNEGAYAALQTMSDRFGPRLAGTPGHAATMDWLEAELQALGLSTRREAFTYPGWTRGEDTATLLAPDGRTLRAVALGYTAPFEPVEAEVAYVARADAAELDPAAHAGQVLLLAPNLTFSHEQQQALADAGVRGLLLINRVGGGQVLARVANRQGAPTPFPLFSITEEEGFWMQRALEAGEPVRVRLATTSEPQTRTGTNLIATLPGTSGQKVLLGAHFDSWDLGQGAIDNGLGVAQVYEAARLLSQHSPDNRHTVEFVWFDAEELGLWGSRRYAEHHTLDDVRVMLNLDMVGEPQGLNAMGFDELLPVLARIQERLGTWRFERALANEPWLGSDHQPFVGKGIPSITFHAPIDPDAVRYYHDFGDTFDKIDRAMLTEASAIIALVTHDLANDETPLRRYAPDETADLLREAGLEDRLRAMDQWPFDGMNAW